MNFIKQFLCTSVCLPLLLLTASAQLSVAVSPPRIVGQKAIVKLAMKNGLAQKIESARAVCFLLDDHSTMIGQSTKWVIGQNNIGLNVGATSQFDFVIAGNQPFVSTNLVAKISFIQLLSADAKLLDVRHSLFITESK
jgi:hypothetical protein